MENKRTPSHPAEPVETTSTIDPSDVGRPHIILLDPLDKEGNITFITRFLADPLFGGDYVAALRQQLQRRLRLFRREALSILR